MQDVQIMNMFEVMSFYPPLVLSSKNKPDSAPGRSKASLAEKYYPRSG